MYKETDLADYVDLVANIKAEEQKSVVTRTRQNSESQWVRNLEVAWPYNSTYKDRTYKV